MNNNCKICGASKKQVRVDMLDVTFYEHTCDCVQPVEVDQDEIKDREIKIDKLIKESLIPHKYRNIDLGTWVHTNDTKALYDTATAFVSNASDNIKQGNGLLFAGAAGTGKTMLQSYIGMHIIRTLAKRVKYVSVTSFIAEIDDAKRSHQSVSTYIDKHINADILILDDVGESKIDDWNKKYLFLLLDGRNNKRCVTLINTMQGVKYLRQMIGGHLVSRILEMAGENIVQIKSKIDMRFYKNGVKK